MKKLLLGLTLGLALYATPVEAQTYCRDSNGNHIPITSGLCDALGIAGSISANLTPFLPSASGARGTPLSVATSDSSGTLPTGAAVVVTNVGTTNPMYCNVNGIAATASDQLITANGGWFVFQVPAAQTVLHCIATGGATTANMTGGSGLPAGTGGGSGGGSSSITSWAGGTLGAMANYGTSPGAVLVPGVNASVTASALPTGAATAANQTAPVPDCGSLPCTNKIGALAPLTATSTQTKVTITTASTYQQYLASNTARKGCTIQFITASHTGYVFFGAAPGDTTTSFQLSAGQSLNCNIGSEVLTDAIQLTSSNNSDVFVVNSW